MFFDALIAIGYLLWNLWAIKNIFRSKGKAKIEAEKLRQSKNVDEYRLIAIPLFVCIMIVTAFLYSFIAHILTVKILVVYLIYALFYRAFSFYRYNKSVMNKDVELALRGFYFRKILRLISFIIAIVLVGHVLL